jgi:hypothetical protein
MNASKVLLGVFGFCIASGLNAGAQGGASTPQSRANELQSRYMTTVRAQLTSKLDTKTAAAGMVLTARTTAEVTLADGTEIPAGTKLMGRVVAVRAKTDENTEAAVTVTFDQAEMKDGKMLPVRTLIRGMSGSAAPPVVSGDSTAAGRGRNSDPIPPAGTDPMGGLGSGPPMPGTRGSGGGGMGGGGGTGGTTRSGRTTQTSPSGAIPDVAVTNPVTSTAEGGETVHVAPKPTGVPGVLLYASPTSDVSGTLIGRDINVRLDNGVQLTLGMISRQAAAGDSGGVK